MILNSTKNKISKSPKIRYQKVLKWDIKKYKKKISKSTKIRY